MKNKEKKDLNLVIPSTKLLTVNSHKLSDTFCGRYYFWRWIMNLVPRSFNINFWFGSTMHTGIEEVGHGKKLPKIVKAMTKTDKDFIKKNAVPVALSQEVRVQRDISKALIKGYYKLAHEKMRGLKLGGTEIHFHSKLKNSSVVYEGTLDAWWKSCKRVILVEGKTSKAPNNDYFRRLKFDKQINGYADALYRLTGKYPRYCYYTVFRKPQIRQRKTETPLQFYTRLQKDLIVRKDWYFIFYKHVFGKGSIKAVMNDIEWKTFDLAAKYDYLTKDQLLDKDNWPREDTQCFNYGTCPYFCLCRKQRSSLYYRFFQMRDIRYPLEKKELDKSRAYDVKSKRGRKPVR